jgi:uncharacterized protein
VTGAAAQRRGSEPVSRAHEVAVGGITFVIDPAGVLYWPEQGILVVADLHLEKGSSFAKRGMLLPPYDTRVTLGRLAQIVFHYTPRLVVALGDSFHDGEGPDRVVAVDRAALATMQRGRDWLWIAGNHDPEPVDGIGGRCAPSGLSSSATSRRKMLATARSPAICTPWRASRCAGAASAGAALRAMGAAW